jgi:hypothetical protein
MLLLRTVVLTAHKRVLHEYVAISAEACEIKKQVNEI